MKTSEPMAGTGSNSVYVDENTIETPPVTPNRMPVVGFIPSTADEDDRQRNSKSRMNTDKFARWILVGCIVVFAGALIVHMVADWNGKSLDSPRIDSLVDTMGYIATTIMGYLFGKNLNTGKN